MKRFLLLLLITFTGISHADTETRSSAWFMSLSRFQFADNYRGFLDLQPRITVDDIPGGHDSSINTVLIRGALGYQLTPGIGIYQGYAIIPTYDPDRVEHRSFQEIFATQKLEKGSTWNHRFRFEQRFLEGVDDTAFRFRYFSRYTHPLTAIHENLTFAINEEVFVNLNDTQGPKAGFNQNRLFVGLNYKINRHLAIETGYQNQFINGQNNADDVVNHIGFFGILTKF